MDKRRTLLRAVPWSPSSRGIAGYGKSRRCPQSEGPDKGPGRYYEQLSGLRSLDVSRTSRKGSFICRSPSLDPWKSPAAPTGIRRFKSVSYQNAAGLWLKYGAKIGKSFSVCQLGNRRNRPRPDASIPLCLLRSLPDTRPTSPSGYPLMPPRCPPGPKFSSRRSKIFFRSFSHTGPRRDRATRLRYGKQRTFSAVQHGLSRATIC
jgi:hypothetical protein